jgi:hypothetical protein
MSFIHSVADSITLGNRQMRIASKDFFNRLRLFSLLLSLGGLLGVGAARAALQFDVFIGYDGIGREASWLPIVCEIKNDGPPITGFVEVSPGSYGKGQTYQVAVELPTGTLKRVTIPVFAVSRHSPVWNIRLANERGKTLAEQTAQRPRRQIGWEIPLIGSLSRTASGAPSLRPILRDQPDAQPASARLLPSIFPDNPLVLEGLNAIYLSSEVAGNLRTSQADAIIGWMNAGGHLIVGVEQVSDISASPWLRSLMPCEPKDMKTIAAHTELQAWLKSELDYRSPIRPPLNSQIVAPGVRRTQVLAPETPFANLPDDSQFELADLQVVTGALRDGRVVVAAGGTPLIATANRGLGRITALMFSPEREPFKSWKHLPTFWARMIEVPGQLYASSDYYPGYGQSPDGIFGAMIDSRQIHKLPIGWLLLLLIVYLGVIGPFDQWWLKRIGKPMLTWITFPCYVALFSLLIYFIGYKLRAGESEYNELHLVDVLRHGDRAELRGRTYVSIYSPNNAKFPLESKQKFATLRGEFLGLGTEATERAAVFQNGDSFKAEVFVPVWTSQLYLSDWWQGVTAPFDAVAIPQDDGWRVTVKNSTGQAVKVAQLVLAGRVVTLGEIAAGRTESFTVKPGDGIALRDFVQQNGAGFQRAAQQRQNAFGASKGGRLTDLPSTAVTASFLSQIHQEQNYLNSFILPPGLDLSQVIERGGAILLAWTPDTAPVPSLNQFKPRRTARNTLWRVPVEIRNAK